MEVRDEEDRGGNAHYSLWLGAKEGLIIENGGRKLRAFIRPSRAGKLTTLNQHSLKFWFQRTSPRMLAPSRCSPGLRYLFLVVLGGGGGGGARGGQNGRRREHLGVVLNEGTENGFQQHLFQPNIWETIYQSLIQGKRPSKMLPQGGTRTSVTAKLMAKESKGGVIWGITGSSALLCAAIGKETGAELEWGAWIASRRCRPRLEGKRSLRKIHDCWGWLGRKNKVANASKTNGSKEQRNLVRPGDQKKRRGTHAREKTKNQGPGRDAIVKENNKR